MLFEGERRGLDAQASGDPGNYGLVAVDGRRRRRQQGGDFSRSCQPVARGRSRDLAQCSGQLLERWTAALAEHGLEGRLVVDIQPPRERHPAASDTRSGREADAPSQPAGDLSGKGSGWVVDSCPGQDSVLEHGRQPRVGRCGRVVDRSDHSLDEGGVPLEGGQGATDSVGVAARTGQLTGAGRRTARRPGRWLRDCRPRPGPGQGRDSRSAGHRALPR